MSKSVHPHLSEAAAADPLALLESGPAKLTRLKIIFLKDTNGEAHCFVPLTNSVDEIFVAVLQ